MPDVLMQSCPICKNDRSQVKEYPYALCNDCENKVTDREGRGVRFVQDSSYKGFSGFYSEAQNSKKYIYDICYINGEELKVYAHRNEVYIQPLNFLKFGSRPGGTINDPMADAQRMPYDPELRRIRKQQIKVRKIIIPAGLVTLLAFLPGALGLLYLKLIQTHNWLFYLSYFLISFTSLSFAWKIIQSRVRKFHNAYYFKQHSYTFFFIGILSVVATVLLSLGFFLEM